jgi:bifunctional DNA-binding transcriptional regulator/antitoxin component of YhaV-PrlF toxin-antitoxin module
MTIIKLTSKRQATLPKKLCEEMNLKPSDGISVGSEVVDDQRVWLMKPAREAEMPWFGALKSYAKNRRHDMDSIRKSIMKARKDGKV